MQQQRLQYWPSWLHNDFNCSASLIVFRMTWFSNWFHNVFAKSFDRCVFRFLFFSGLFLFYLGLSKISDCHSKAYLICNAICEMQSYVIIILLMQTGQRYIWFDVALFFYFISWLMCYLHSWSEFSKITKMGLLTRVVKLNTFILICRKKQEILPCNCVAPPSQRQMASICFHRGKKPCKHAK